MSSTLITVAPTGAESTKADVPALPTTLDELVETAKRCEAAGAAMIHVHIRDADHQPTLDLGRLKETVAALRANTSLVVQLSTGGAVTDPYEHRLQVLEAAPDSCSLTMGTVNFGDDVFMNPWPFVTELYLRTQEHEVVPEFELFDLGHVAALHRLLDKFGLPYGGKVHCDLVMGVPGGMPGTADALVAAVNGLPAGRDLLVGHRDRPDVADRRADRAGQGRPPAGRDGGHPDPGQGRAGHPQRRAGRPGRGAREPGPASADDLRRGAGTAQRQALTAEPAGPGRSSYSEPVVRTAGKIGHPRRASGRS